MSKRTNTDKARVHASRGWNCPCGRRVYGNGGKTSHRKACKVWLVEEYLWVGRKIMNGKPPTMPYWKWDELNGRFEYARERLRKIVGFGS